MRPHTAWYSIEKLNNFFSFLIFLLYNDYYYFDAIELDSSTKISLSFYKSEIWRFKKRFS